MPFANPFSLAHKTALIAGASRGIGQAIGEAVARAGARTLLASRNAARLEKIAARLREEGHAAEACELDIASKASRERCLAGLPPIDILINVAGINQRKRFEDFTEEEQARILETNLHGVVELTRAVGRRMIERVRAGEAAGGKVIHIGSLTSVLGLPYVSAYTMTKSALAGLTRCLAMEWGRYNIQVNCLAPGFILTDLTRELWSREEMQRWLRGAQGNPRMGTPEDIAPAAVFLASPGSDYITGQVVMADGGFSAGAVWPFEP
jgi:NAD(P)-dependent dehydrogenase (short-subunit alcohol dehydrogenase family)